MVWTKHKVIPRGFTDFTWKKNRFTTHRLSSDISSYHIIDNADEDKWLVRADANNSEKSLETKLNNLYERNGFLRRECSKQAFLANKYKKDAEFWKESYLRAENSRITEMNEANHWYNEYQMLKIKKEKEEVDWDELHDVE